MQPENGRNKNLYLLEEVVLKNPQRRFAELFQLVGLSLGQAHVRWDFWKLG
jgi:hypothetical protein